MIYLDFVLLFKIVIACFGTFNYIMKKVEFRYIVDKFFCKKAIYNVAD